ncbi:sulfite oxidase heme-binding subunit YedZ [Sulfurospirillum sp. 1612]|uniref:sulfite oxidase heme-binding subunit YedZ n=1 Tax=Sulfurospirillum sp. 1612 TaxID=3094835 RepID=UPI002F91D3F8
MKKKGFLALILLAPLGFLLIKLPHAIDPIKYIYTITGVTSICMLNLTLLPSLLRRWVNVMRYRRMLGLFTFFYVMLHFLNFVILDAQFDLALVVKETYEKPFVYLGMIAFAVLLLMSITSSKKLFARFHRWHRFVYMVLILVVIHAAMAQKVLSFNEYAYMFMALLLLGFRIPFKRLLQKRIKGVER